jgi:hypothetical protein
MRALSEATRAVLPAPFKKFRHQAQGWLCQLYYRRADVHYEVSNLGERRGVIEIGLHFESKNAAENAQWLRVVDRRRVEIKATLGAQWEAEPWDRGWTNVYKTLPYQPFDKALLKMVAQRLSGAIRLLEPDVAGAL